MTNTKLIRTLGVAFSAALLALLSLGFGGTDLFSKTLASAFLPSTATEDESGDALEPATITDTALLDELRLHPTRLPLVDASEIDSETLWLARCIYSETKQPIEQELVAWVIRNRVETGYRGKRTYESSILDPYQFSAFIPGSRTRRFYSGLDATSTRAGFQRALAIAHHVRTAGEDRRPFSEETRHFYSERSMVGVKHPAWSKGKQPVAVNRRDEIDPQRFRFFERVR
jgi:hypothetical protein